MRINEYDVFFYLQKKLQINSLYSNNLNKNSILSVYWTIEDLPVIYGRNVTLFCNTSAVGSQKTTWMKESDVILHQGLSFQQDKYSGKEENDGSSLIIINATLSDFNTSYTCLSDVCSYESVLKINSTNFICK